MNGVAVAANVSWAVVAFRDAEFDDVSTVTAKIHFNYVVPASRPILNVMKYPRRLFLQTVVTAFANHVKMRRPLTPYARGVVGAVLDKPVLIPGGNKHQRQT